jgi:hypothetical protein
MVHIFVHLMRAEFDSLLTWFVNQAENSCDGVGTNRHSCEVEHIVGAAAETEVALTMPSSTTTTTTAVVANKHFNPATQRAFQSRPRFVLATSFLFRGLALRSIEYMLEILASGSIDDEADDEEDYRATSLHRSNDKRLENVCDRCSNTLLAQYIGIKSRETVRDIYERMEDIASSSTSSTAMNVNPLAFVILNNAAAVGTDTSVLLGGLLPAYDGKNNAVRNGPTPGNRKNNSSGKGGGIQVDIDRIFSKKVTIYGGTSFSRETLLQEYFRVVFKALSEHSRSLTFTTLGFHTCLITARYLFDVLPTYCKDTESLDYLLSDWIGSVNDRCVNVEYLSEGDIENVVTLVKQEQRSS